MSQIKTKQFSRFHKILVWFLAICLVSQNFSFTTAYAANSNLNKSLVDEQTLQESQQDAAKLNAEIESIENGDLVKQPIQNFDQFRLAHQKIQIFEGNKVVDYNLNDFQVEIPSVAHTGIRTYYKKETQELVFEATRGANKEGKNGVVVARQIIPNLNIAALVQDEEILSFVDQQGRLHAIDMGFVTEQLFKSPIPIFQNLWEPTKLMDLSTSEVKLKYLTLGTKPFSENQLSDMTVLPKNEKNQTIFTAGDLAFEFTNPSGEHEVVGVFARDVTLQRFSEGAQLLQWMSVMVSPDNQNIEVANKILNEIEKNKELAEKADQSSDLPISVKASLKQIKSEQISALIQSAQRAQSIKEKRRGKFSLDDWKNDYEKIVQKMKSDKPDVDEATIAQFWNQGIEAVKVESPLQKSLTEKQSKVSALASSVKSKMDLKLLAKIFAGVGVAYLGLPYLKDYSETIDQLKVVSWLYDHLYPSVLKDSVYRTPLLLSTASLVAIWPASVAMSAAVGKAFKKMSEKLESSDSKMARTVRDLAKNWGDLNSWQRITTFGMRIYAWLIYPYWRVVATMLRQKTFFTALENGLNPFTLVKANSDLANKVGLTEDTRIGLNSILSSAEKINDRSNINLKLQSALAEQKLKRQNMAWALASLVVCEKNQIDPATLLMMSDGQVNLDKNKLSQIFTDQKTKADWELIADQLLQSYNDLSKNQSEIEKIDSEMFLDFYEKAQKIAESVKAQSDLQKKVSNLRLQFKKRSRQFLAAAVNIGKQDHEFLKKVYTNEFVSKQVQQEFSIDHLMVVGIVAFYGERADLNDPSQLAADPNGLLWTSKSHWNDIFLNTFAHFFVSGSSMTLVFQKPKPQSAKSYQPKEDYLYVSESRTQGFGSGAWAWTKDVVNPLKADLGGIMLKRFTKRLTTFTAGLTLSVGLRTLMLSAKMGTLAAFSLAKSAWLFNFFAAQWFYGFVWDPIQSGNRLEGERFARQESQLKEARYLLANNQFEEGHNLIMQLYFESNKTDLLRLEMSVLRQLSSTDLKQQILAKKSLKVDLNSNERYYFGLLSELAFALQSKDMSRVQQAENLLQQLISKDQNIDLTEVKKLSSVALLKFSISNTPIYTEPNHVISWLTTWAGAVSSTVLAIPLSVILTTNSLMSSPLFIAKWIAISLSLYGVSYLTLSKNMAEKYIRFYKNNLAETQLAKLLRSRLSTVKEHFKNFQDSIYVNQKQKVQVGISQCKALF